MGRQLNFCCGERLTWKLLEFARSQGNMIYHDFDNKRWIDITGTEDLSTFHGCLLACFSKVDSCDLIRNERGNIDRLKSPVIEFSYSGMDRDREILGISRVYYNKQWSEKSPRFDCTNEEMERWYNSIVRFLKKHLKRIEANYVYSGDQTFTYLTYVDEEAEQLLSEGYLISQTMR